MEKETNPALPGGIVETGCLNGGLTSINSCPEQHSEQFDPTAALLKALDDIEILKEKLKDIEKLQTEVSKLNAEVAKQGEKLNTMSESRLKEFDSFLDYIDKKVEARIKNQAESKTTSTVGKITEQRVAEVIRLLKSTPTGSMPFKILRSKMGLKPNQFSRVIDALDGRKFEVTFKRGAPKEKLLRIKARWS